jgi:outer membrane protein
MRLALISILALLMFGCAFGGAYKQGGNTHKIWANSAFGTGVALDKFHEKATEACGGGSYTIINKESNTLAGKIDGYIRCDDSFMSEKVGWYDMQKILKESDIGKKEAAGFKKFYEEKTAPVNQMKRSLDTLKDELEKQSSNMTQSSQKEKETAYQQKLRDYQLLVNDTNEELKKRDKEMTQKMVQEVTKVAERIKQQEKYTAITPIIGENAQRPKGEDITDKVIKDFNLYVIATPPASNVGIQSDAADSKDAQKLKELKKLKNEGLITEDEYESKRKAIVDGM